MDTPTSPLWRARPLTDWRGNGAAAFLVGGLFLFLLCLAGSIWTWNRPNDILPPDIMAALAASGLALALVGACVRIFGNSEWTFDGRTLHFTAGRQRRPDLDLSRIRLVDIADRTDGLCDLLFYLQPKDGEPSGGFNIPRLPKDNAEAGLDALRRAGVPVATPLDAPAHAFPAWMTPRERRALGSFLGRGERLLWAEGPAPRTPFILWYIFLLGLDWYLASRVFDLASIATRLRNALQASDGTTAALMLLLLATAVLVLLAVFVAPPLFVHTHRWLSVRWISTHRLCGVSAPDGRRHLLATACLTEPPVTVPRTRNRADVFIACADGTSTPLSTLAPPPPAPANEPSASGTSPPPTPPPPSPPSPPSRPRPRPDPTVGAGVPPPVRPVSPVRPPPSPPPSKFCGAVPVPPPFPASILFLSRPPAL